MKKKTESLSEEKAFMKQYDDSKYEKPSVTVDMAIFSVFDEETDNYRKLPEKILKILLIKRGASPYKNCYALPGGFVKKGENIERAAKRELYEETNVECEFMEELHTFSAPDRDPRRWVITAAYMALLDASKVHVKAGDDAAEAEWFSVSMQEQENRCWKLALKGEQETLTATLRDCSKEWDVFPKLEPVESETLAFDHELIIGSAVLMLRKWVRDTRIALRLLPEKFTLKQLQQVHETVRETALLTPAFRRKVMDYVVETGEATSDEGHRPALLYREKLNVEKG